MSMKNFPQAVVYVFLASCTSEGAMTEDRAAGPLSMEAQVLDILETSVRGAISELDHEALTPDDILIARGFEPPRTDPVRDLGLTTDQMARQVAAEMGYQTRRRDEVIVCTEDAGERPRPSHACRLIEGSAFYIPQVLEIDGDTARTAIHFITHVPSYAAGTFLFDLERSETGWEIVGQQTITAM